MLHKNGVTSEEGRATRRQSKHALLAVLKVFFYVGVCPAGSFHAQAIASQSEVFARAEERVSSFSEDAKRLAPPVFLRANEAPSAPNFEHRPRPVACFCLRHSPPEVPG